MKRPSRLLIDLTATGLLVAAVAAGAAEEEAYSPLGARLATIQPSLLQGPGGAVQAGLAYTDDDNYRFGEYNGLYEEGPTLIGNLQWQDFSAGDSYWQVSLADVGLDTREGVATWGRPGRLKVTLGFDSQVQVRNDSGRTPFSGSSELTLPENWVSGLTTSEWTALDETLRRFERKVERDRYFLDVDYVLNDRWSLRGGLSYEEKEGTTDTGAAIFSDMAVGDAVLLPQRLDQNTTEFELGLRFSGERLHLDGQIGYSAFDNSEEQLVWQNPYSSFGDRVAYPLGEGALGTMPDNEQLNGRISGQFIFSPAARLQFDGSYAVTEQDQSYLDYTVNPDLVVTEPLPRDNFDGDLATGAFNARFLVRPARKLDLDMFYRHRNRDYDTPRDGYRYVRGDAADQPREALTVYNTDLDYRSDTLGLEGSYRLPLRSRLKVGYAYEILDRTNAAVEKTEEDRYTIGYRIQPWSQFSANLELLYGDRRADTYEWDQHYYALLDPALINATPATQRFINHPLLSQFYLSNREQWEGKLDLNWLPTDHWNLALNLLWHEDDYDKSDLGLTETDWQRVNLSATYAAAEGLSATVYAGYDQSESDQSSRSFRGGQEKNAFVIYPPLPQASDPDRDWDLETEDSSVTLGANLAWQVSAKLALDLDYSYVDTTSEQAFTTYAASVAASDLPDVDTKLHRLELGGTWTWQDNLSLRLDYQYYRYKSDDWAWQDLGPATVDKLLSFGERNPNEQIHYVGASVLYRWQ